MMIARVKHDSIIPHSSNQITYLKKMTDLDFTAGKNRIEVSTVIPNEKNSKITGLLDITWSAIFTI
jgi:hypothetical protein